MVLAFSSMLTVLALLQIHTVVYELDSNLHHGLYLQNHTRNHLPCGI